MIIIAVSMKEKVGKSFGIVKHNSNNKNKDSNETLDE